MKPVLHITFLLSLLSFGLQAQDSHQTMGKKALLDGNFSMAVVHLERAVAADSANVNALYMLGYSYYHAENYKSAVSAFSKVINYRPAETSAYYYRGKARTYMANYAPNLANTEREKLFLSAVRDFSKAISLNGDDMKFYQNRALAYHDYGVLKAQKTPKFYDKTKALEALRACIADYQKVLEFTPGRKDIVTQLEEARSHLKNVSAQ
jgi:tetratricopeptide (TPR) repeat protein